MKRIACILFIALLTGCSLRGGDAAKRLCTGIGESCSGICLSSDKRTETDASYESVFSDGGSLPVISLSLGERTGSLLTW